jgi:hypothetical protein
MTVKFKWSLMGPTIAKTILGKAKIEGLTLGNISLKTYYKATVVITV